jgi:hypothetical protein
MSVTHLRRTTTLAVLVMATCGVALSGTAAVAGTHLRAHTSLSIRAVFGSVNPGGGDVVKGDLQSTDGHTAGRFVALFANTGATETTWSQVGRHRTGVQGQVAFQVIPSATTRYQLRFAGNAQQQPSRSGVVVVRVRDTTSLTIAVGSSSIEPGDSDTVNGVLSFDNVPIVGGTVRLLGGVVGTKLHYLASASSAADGSVTFPVTPASTSRYMLVFNKTATNAYARSAVAAIHVRKPSSLSIRARQNTKLGIEIISGDLRGSFQGLAHRMITLLDRPAGTDTWSTVGKAFTKRHGVVVFKVPAPTASEDYQLVFPGGPIYDGCHSGVVTVTVN